MLASAELWAKSDPSKASPWKLDMGVNYGVIDHSGIKTRGIPAQMTGVINELMGQSGFYMGFSNKRWGARFGASGLHSESLKVKAFTNEYKLSVNSLWSEAFYTFYRVNRLGFSAVIGGSMMFYGYEAVEFTGTTRENTRSFSPYAGLDLTYQIFGFTPVPSIRKPEISLITGFRVYDRYLDFQTTNLGFNNDVSFMLSLGYKFQSNACVLTSRRVINYY